MRVLSLAAVSGALVSLPNAAVMNGFPASWDVFSANFSQPKPPLVPAEYKANWNQHKWDADVSHIASGFLYHSPSNNKVRVDEAYESALGSSLFDYSNVTEEGVANRQWTLTPAVNSPSQCFQGFVEPAFPLISGDFLVANGAVFGGVVKDPWVGEVAVWKVMYQDTIPATVLLDQNHIIQGYDFWSTERRTYVVTRFFNIVIGRISGEVFDFPC